MNGKLGQFVLTGAIAVAIGTGAYHMSRAWVSGGLASDQAPLGASERHDDRSLLMLIYIGKSTCKWCNDPALPAAIETIRRRMEAESEFRDQQFMSLGLAVDYSVAAGITHLDRMGSFDQVFTGGGWLNEMAFRYIWENLPGPPSTPSIVVVERTLSKPDSSLGTSRFGVVAERVLARKVGLYEIQRWVSDGVPIPRIMPELRHGPNPA